MSYKQDRVISENVKQLIKLLLNFEETDTKYAKCEQYALNTLKHHRFLSVDSHATKRSMAGLVEKFRIHGHFEASKRLEDLFEHFISQTVFQNHDQFDLKWSLISLLIHLAYNPTGILNEKTPQVSITTELLPQDESTLIDWPRILSEGLELRENYDTDSLSSWSDSEDEEIVLFSDALLPNMSAKCANSTPKRIICDTKPSPENFDNYESGLQGTEWLPAQKLQPAWWESGSSFDADSTLSAAHLAKDWNEYIKTLSCGIIEIENPYFVSEYCVIRELIWLMIVPQTPNKTRIFYRDEENVFHVKNDVTIPSLRGTTFRELLAPFCKNLTILYAMESFSEKVSKSIFDEKRAPSSYEAYNEAVQRLLESLKVHLSELEEQVRSQDDIFTLLTLGENLESYMRKLRVLYNIHNDSVLEWRNIPANICVAHMLTKLYDKSYTQDTETAILSFVLFVNSMKVYLNIIQSWLNGDKLEDPRGEFSIESYQPDHEIQEFRIRKYPNNFIKNTDNPFFKTLMKKILYAGQSIHILQRLSCVHTTLTQVRLQENLHITFIKSIFGILSQYDLKSQDETSNPNMVCVLNEEIPEKNLKFVPEIDDALLKVVFNKYISKKKKDRSIKRDMDIHKLYERLNSIPHVPLKEVLDKALYDILNDNCMKACSAVINILKDNYELQKHLDALQNIMLMHCTGPMYNFYNDLFVEMETGQYWNTPYYLTSQLDAFLSYSQFSNIAHFFCINMQNPIRSVNNSLKCLDYLMITYAVQYPLSIIITEDNLKKYQDCMHFLLKVNWCFWALQNLRFSSELRRRLNYVHSAEVNSRKLQMLRFWLLHAIGSIHSYLFGQVLHTAKNNLRENINLASTLEDLVAAHKEFIDDVHEHCLLVPKHKPVLKIIMQLLKLVQMVRAEWIHRFQNKHYDSDSYVFHEDGYNDWEQIASMESVYNKCHLYLQDIFKNNLVQGENDEYSDSRDLDKYCFVFLNAGITPLHLQTAKNILRENSVTKLQLRRSHKRSHLSNEHSNENSFVYHEFSDNIEHSANDIDKPKCDFKLEVEVGSITSEDQVDENCCSIC